jgi:RNA polymerase sigma factor (sigma-70 family)
VATGMVVSQQELQALADKQREQQALCDLWQRYARDLVRFAAHLTGNRGDAEDIAQEVLLRLFQTCTDRNTFPDRFRTWLFATARNIALGWLRRREVEQNDLSPDIEKELRCFARKAAQFLESRLAACIELILDRLQAACDGSGYRSAYRFWLALRIEHPPKDLFQAAVWSVRVPGRCVPEQA